MIERLYNRLQWWLLRKIARIHCRIEGCRLGSLEWHRAAHGGKWESWSIDCDVGESTMMWFPVHRWSASSLRGEMKRLCLQEVWIAANGERSLIDVVQVVHPFGRAEQAYLVSW